jgi:hypothetical protein
VRHNVKFLPRKDHPEFSSRHDSNHSDIDVLGFNPLKKGVECVWAVSCKSWQSGFNPERMISDIEENRFVAGKEAWKRFRELASPKWSEAFVNAIEEATGRRRFTYVTAVTKLNGDAERWETHTPFRKAINNNPIKILTLENMLVEVYGKLSCTLAGTEMGRMLQLFRAAGVNIKRQSS